MEGSQWFALAQSSAKLLNIGPDGVSSRAAGPEFDAKDSQRGLSKDMTGLQKVMSSSFL